MITSSNTIYIDKLADPTIANFYTTSSTRIISLSNGDNNIDELS